MIEDEYLKGIMARSTATDRGFALSADNGTLRGEVRNQAREIERLASENERLRKLLLDLADAADAVGVKYFDTDDLSFEVLQMQECTLAARAALALGGEMDGGEST